MPHVLNFHKISGYLSVPAETALDFTQSPLGEGFYPGEYVGIMMTPFTLPVQVWTTYAGTRAGETGDRSVIYSTRIDQTTSP